MIGQVIGHNAQGGQLAKFYFSVFSLLEQLVKGNGRPVQTAAQQPSPRPQPMSIQQQGFRPQGVQMGLAGLPNSNPHFGQNQASLPPLPLQPQTSMPSVQLNTQLAHTQFTNSTDFLNQALDSMTSAALDEKNEDLPAPDQITQTVSSSGNAVEETLEGENLPNEVKSEEIIDDGTYVPKTRMVQSLGGIDFTTLAPVLKRPKPSRDQYGIIN